MAEAAGEAWVVAQRSLPLDVDGHMSIRPDLLFDGPASVIAVADLKYKLLDEQGRLPNGDVYQLVIYCARLGLDVGHLIYAAGDPRPDPFDIIGTGVRLAARWASSCSADSQFS